MIVIKLYQYISPLIISFSWIVKTTRKKKKKKGRYQLSPYSLLYFTINYNYITNYKRKTTNKKKKKKKKKKNKHLKSYLSYTIG